MRKTLIALLLAGALAPASSYAQDRDYGRGERSETEQSERASRRDGPRENRPQRVERTESANPANSARPAGVVERPDRKADRLPRANQSTDLDRAMRSDRMQRPDRAARDERPQRSGSADGDPQPVQQVDTPAIAQPVQQSGRRSDNLVDGFRQVARGGSGGHGNDHDGHDDHDWSNDWRKDKRYDWWHYRSRYGSLYRLGHYRDPYGWGYRRWTMGYTLWPSYYGSSFWLNDPWMYRLPPAYGPYRWVRYYDDALLVNIYTGHVVDVVYNFFW